MGGANISGARLGGQNASRLVGGGQYHQGSLYGLYLDDFSASTVTL